jgi:hypothetical protein
LTCKAGGTYNATGSTDQHTIGSERDFKFLLTKKEDSMPLDRRYTWVKCNQDFKGYYITDYSKEVFAAIEAVLLSNPEVKNKFRNRLNLFRKFILH